MQQLNPSSMNTRFLKLVSVCWTLSFVSFLTPLQAQVNYWSAPEESRSVIGANDLLPDLPGFDKGYRVQLDLDGFIQQSRKAAKEGSGAINTSTAVWLPLPDGTFERFRILESSLMEPGLAAKFPEVKSYLIKGVDDPYCAGRMTVSPDLFNAYFSSLTNEREVFVRRISKTDNSQYVSFRAEDDPVFSEAFTCHWEPEDVGKDQSSEPLMRMANPYVAGSELKVFRMSMTVIGELAEAQGWTTSAQALAGVLTQLDVVNTVYERDLSVRFVLPENNDLLFFLDADTDPFLLENGDQNLRDNHMITEQYLGIENFDVGLVLLYQGNCCGANRGICDDDSKGMNMSAFNSLKVLCHEIGHQFDARHTWAYCNGQGEFEAHEPGSGSNIMGYSTSCGDDYVVPFISNLFFSVSSIEQMNEYMVDRNCNEVLPTNNTPPTVTVPASGFCIPTSTPFELTGSGSDAENDNLTYIWEQFNRKGVDWTTAGPPC